MLYHPKTNSVVMHLPDPLQVRELIPQSKMINLPGYNIAFNLTQDATKILRNIGIQAPAPIRYHYDWPGKFTPGEHQIQMAEFLTLHQKCFNLSEMGTQKTAPALWAADYLMKKGLVRKALIMPPLSTVDRVWMNEIFSVLMHRTAVIVHGGTDKRRRAIEADVDFYILNHEGLVIDWLVNTIAHRPDIDLIIVDEASKFRNAANETYKRLKRIIRPDQRLWMLTGTPAPHEPTDAWALARLVCPNRVPKYFGQFRRQVMDQVTQFKYEPKPDAYRTVYNSLQPAIRFKKKDCVTLPPVTFEDRQVRLTPEQNRAIKEMRNTMRMEAQSGRKIDAVNAADKINKIRQILCGSVKNPITDLYEDIPHGPRTETLMDTIAEASAKVIVIVPFKGIIRSLEKELSKVYTVGVLNGDVAASKRDKIITLFKTTPNPHILLCHPKVMAHGLNLTEADMLIFYAPIYSNDEMEQVQERFNRAGQKRAMTIVRMGANAIEWAIYNTVAKRGQLQSSILELYQQVLNGP